MSEMVFGGDVFPVWKWVKPSGRCQRKGFCGVGTGTEYNPGLRSRGGSLLSLERAGVGAKRGGFL
jgi:hypothetical protein